MNEQKLERVSRDILFSRFLFYFPARSRRISTGRVLSHGARPHVLGNVSKTDIYAHTAPNNGLFNGWTDDKKRGEIFRIADVKEIPQRFLCNTRTSAVPHRPRSRVATKCAMCRPNASICSRDLNVTRLHCHQITPFSKLRPIEVNVFFILAHVRSNRTKARSETSQTLFDHYPFCRKTKIVKKTITKRIGI